MLYGQISFYASLSNVDHVDPVESRMFIKFEWIKRAECNRHSLHLTWRQTDLEVDLHKTS